VALEEALANALYHGNLEVSSSLREDDDRAYYALVEQRVRESPYRDRRIHVEAKLSREQAVFVIRDEGCGFDPALLPDPTDPANLEKSSGRGVLLMRTFMDEVCYNNVGNQVTLCKRRNEQHPAEGQQ
jgi:anti-sigma regulatory factor (Ser/Thr protein kinase)